MMMTTIDASVWGQKKKKKQQQLSKPQFFSKSLRGKKTKTKTKRKTTATTVKERVGCW
jgi:hypothetical protein